MPRGARAEEDALPIIDLAADETGAPSAAPRPGPSPPRGAGLRPRHWLPFVAVAVVLVVVASLVQHGGSHSAPTATTTAPTAPTTTTVVAPPDHDAGGRLFPGIGPASGTLAVGGRYGLRRVDLATGRITAWEPTGLPDGPVTVVASNGATTIVRATSLSGSALWAIDSDGATALTAASAFVGPDGSIWTWQAPIAHRIAGATAAPETSDVTLTQYALYAVVAGGFVVDTRGEASIGLSLVTGAPDQKVVRTLSPPGALLVAAHPHRIAWVPSDCSPPACLLHVTDVDTGAQVAVARLVQPPLGASGAFSADASFLAVPDGNGIDVVDLRTGTERSVVTNAAAVEGPSLAFVGSVVIGVEGARNLLAYDAATGRSVPTAATFADRSSLAVLAPASRWLAAVRIGRISLPPLFGHPTGLTAISGDGTVTNLDSGETERVTQGPLGDRADLVPLGSGALAFFGGTNEVEFVDAHAHVTDLGAGDDVVGSDGVHAWIVHVLNDATLSYVPVTPGTLARGAPVHTFTRAVGASGPQLAFREQPAFDAPPRLTLWDPVTNARRSVALPAGAGVVAVNSDYALVGIPVTTECTDACTSLVAVDLATGKSTLLGPTSSDSEVVLAPHGSRLVGQTRGTVNVFDVRTSTAVVPPTSLPTAGGALVAGWSATGWLLVQDTSSNRLIAPDGSVSRTKPFAVGQGPLVLVPTQ